MSEVDIGVSAPRITIAEKREVPLGRTKARGCPVCVPTLAVPADIQFDTLMMPSILVESAATTATAALSVNVEPLGFAPKKITSTCEVLAVLQFMTTA